MDLQDTSWALRLTLVLGLLSLGSGQWQVIGPDKHTQVLVGEDVVFSCFLYPETSAETMEVRFFRDQSSEVVHLYRDGRDEDGMQMAAYRGRTEMMKDSIEDGHISLTLKNVTVLDVGLYGCKFSSQTNVQEATWELQVSALGSAPLISILGYVGGNIQLLCHTSGWFPQPTVRLKNAQGHYLPSDSKVNTDIFGLFDVETSFTVQENTRNISCSIQHPDVHQELESRVYIEDTFFQPSPYRLASIILGVLSSLLWVAVAGIMIFYSKSIGRRRELEVQEWREAWKHEVEVTLDPDTAHPQLYISDLKAVTYRKDPQKVPDSEKRFRRPCVVASQGFCEGKHYWNVDVGHKETWCLGVCQDDVNRKEENVTLSPNNGYWILELKKKHQCFTYNPNKTKVPMRIPPTKLGIFLDYEGGIISFFNVNDKSHIYTITDQFKGLLRPYIEFQTYNEKSIIPIVICTNDAIQERSN